MREALTPGVPEAEALRVVDDDAEAVAEVAEVARGGRVAGAERVVAHTGVLLALRAEEDELRPRVARRRADVRERLHERDADDDRGHGEDDRERSGAAPRASTTSPSASARYAARVCVQRRPA